MLTLLPAAAGAAGPVGHVGHGAPAAGAPAAPDTNADGVAAGGADEKSGSADGMLAAGLLAGLGGGAAIGWLVSRWRRRDPAEATALSEVTGDADEPTEAGPTTGSPVRPAPADAEPVAVAAPARTG